MKGCITIILNWIYSCILSWLGYDEIIYPFHFFRKDVISGKNNRVVDGEVKCYFLIFSEYIVLLDLGGID